MDEKIKNSLLGLAIGASTGVIVFLLHLLLERLPIPMYFKLQDVAGLILLISVLVINTVAGLVIGMFKDKFEITDAVIPLVIFIMFILIFNLIYGAGYTIIDVISTTLFILLSWSLVVLTVDKALTKSSKKN